MKNKWRTTAPDNFTGLCLVTIDINGNRSVSEGWADICGNKLKMSPSAIAWMPKPSHCDKDATGWLSEYRGDELPKKDGWYMVSRENKFFAEKLFFNTKKQTFGGQEDFLAWMPLPQPYQGLKP